MIMILNIHVLVAHIRGTHEGRVFQEEDVVFEFGEGTDMREKVLGCSEVAAPSLCVFQIKHTFTRWTCFGDSKFSVSDGIFQHLG